MGKLKGKSVAECATEIVEVVLPNDANPLGNLLGGKVMHLIDIAGAVTAHRHARSQVVTVAVDNLDFLYPIRVGELVVLCARMTRAFRTSMEVEVRVYRENYLTGERQQTSSAFVTYVALDGAGVPQEVPPLIPHTRNEKRRYREALKRRRLRLAVAARAHRRYFERDSD
jgi:acyl-CoA hydrolase